jgi:hypothetical protein
MEAKPTPEGATTALIKAITYELDRHGAASLADVIVTIIGSRADALEDTREPEAAELRRQQAAFEDARDRIVGVL